LLEALAEQLFSSAGRASKAMDNIDGSLAIHAAQPTCSLATACVRTLGKKAESKFVRSAICSTEMIDNSLKTVIEKKVEYTWQHNQDLTKRAQDELIIRASYKFSRQPLEVSRSFVFPRIFNE
jgi:hypothetical protein